MDLALGINDGTALVARGPDSFSRGDLRAMSNALADALAKSAACRAIVCSDNPVDIIRAMDACARLGINLYIAHTTTPPDQLAEIIDHYRIGYLVGATDEPTGKDATAEPSGGPHIYMMTSGTSGTPKIATHTLESLGARARAATDHPTNRMAKWLLSYQPSGFAGVQVILTAVMTNGLIVAPMARTPRGFLEAAERWGVTQISGTPTFWRSFLMAGDVSALRLRQVTMGGEGADQATLDRVKAAFPEARLTHTYASTEAGFVFAVHDGQEGFPATFLSQTMHGIQLRVHDGFLQIRSPHRMQGYISEAAQPVLDDGWLATTDRCEVVGDRVHLLGRADKTINVGGYKIHPLAVEKILLSIREVSEARVYGVPNPISGALVAADIVLTPGQDAAVARPRILAVCRAQLPSFQVPRVLKFVDAIDTGASGKKA